MIIPHQTIMQEKPIVDPVDRTEVHSDGLRFTHGCGPAGYDLRLDGWQIRTDADKGDFLDLSPNDFILASAVEKFQMPDDLIGYVKDKSSWVRRGITVQNTVIEPSWCGFLTLEIKNISHKPARLYRGVGICQVVFHRLEAPTDQPYAGKYQGQSAGPQEAR